MCNNCIAENDKLTARLVVRESPDVDVSISMIKRRRKRLGWIPTRPQYCQLIRDSNKENRLDWCKQCMAVKDEFNIMLYSVTNVLYC